MLITPHLLVGAAIGAKIKHFGWTIGLGLISHFVLDKIPHWVYGIKVLKNFSQTKFCKTLIFFLQMAADGLMGLVIIFLIVWQKNMINLNYLSFIMAGALAAIFPDLILGFIKIFNLESKKLSKMYIYFHEKICHSRKGHIAKPNLLGLGSQIFVSVIAILILLL